MYLDLKLDDSVILSKLQQVKQKVGKLKPVMAEIGDELLESTKQRFETSTGPDGEKWAPNQESTLTKMLSKTKGNYKKKGGLSAKGARRVAGKKPLIGESKALSGTIRYRASSNQLELGSSLIYSRVQHYGAGKGAFGSTKRGTPIPWGDIPARPYLGFSDEDKSTILEILESYLSL